MEQHVRLPSSLVKMNEILEHFSDLEANFYGTPLEAMEYRQLFAIMLTKGADFVEACAGQLVQLPEKFSYGNVRENLPKHKRARIEEK